MVSCAAVSSLSKYPLKGKWRNVTLERFVGNYAEGKSMCDVLEGDENDALPPLTVSAISCTCKRGGGGQKV